MTTLTLTPEQALNLHVPATVELLEGWSGPGIAVVLADEAMGRSRDRRVEVVVWDGTPMSGDDVFTAGEPGIFPVSAREYRALLLPLSRPEVIDRLYRVMAAGVRCPHPAGLQWPQQAIVSGHRWVVCGQCNAHNGEPGYLRPPVDLSAFRNVKAEGWGPELEAALLYLSWVRMAGGMGPIGYVFAPRIDGCRAGRHDVVLSDLQAAIRAHEPRTPDTCDSYWLSLGNALLDITPEGPTLRALVP